MNMRTSVARVFFAAALTFALALPSPARADEQSATATVTIETDTGALLVTGPKADVAALRDALTAAGAGSWQIDRIAEFTEKEYPALKTQVFMRGAETTAGHQESFELPLRRAILSGLLPPVEGLTTQQAETVLGASGFAAVQAKQWDVSEDSEKAAMISAAGGHLVVLTGTEPSAVVKIFIVKTGKADNADGG